MEGLMKILMSVAFAIAGLTAVQSVQAADLNVGPRVIERSGPVYGPAYVVGPVWRADRPADLLYTYAPEYPGWRGDPYYYSCGTVRVRETLPDGTVVIRRVRAC
jgi:hypothetical protein